MDETAAMTWALYTGKTDGTPCRYCHKPVSEGDYFLTTNAQRDERHGTVIHKALCYKAECAARRTN